MGTSRQLRREGAKSMDDRINILLITDDEHRWDFMGTQAPPQLRIPSIKRLSSEGVTLTNAISNCPICMPTRFSWLYGLYASQGAASLLDNAGDWPTHLPSLAQALQREGYHTALIGKLHSLGGLYHRDVVAHEGLTRARGFHDVFEVCGKSLAYWYDCRWTRYLRSRGLLERYREDVASRTSMIGGAERYEPSFLPGEHHMDRFIGNRVCRWLEEYDGARPFFLHASFCGPHFPLDPPEELFDHYRPEEMPPPAVPEALSAEDGTTHSPRDELPEWQRQRALYCGLIEQVDREIGRVLDLLTHKTWERNTLVVFTTDHGDMLGDLGLEHKGVPYDASCRTPVVLRLPEVLQPGQVLDSPAEAVDLPVTLLDAAGAGSRISGYLPSTPGRSYWDYARGLEADHRKWAFSECHGGKRAWRMCRERDWKYVHYADGRDLLFHTEKDPLETTNLANLPESSRRISHMRSLLIRSLSAIAAPDTDGGSGTYSRTDL